MIAEVFSVTTSYIKFELTRDRLRLLRFVSYILFVLLRQCAIAAFIYTLLFSHISSANLLSVHYMKVYSGFFIFSSINQKEVFLYRSWPYEANML